MPRSVALCLVTVTAVGACSDESPGNPLPPEVAEHAVVLSPDDVGEYGPDADWTPRTQDVLAAEPLLEEAVDAARSGEEPELSPFGDYVRQYAGVEGDVLVVNALCNGEDHDWREEWVVVLDGGACFWTARVEDGAVTSLRVNGTA